MICNKPFLVARISNLSNMNKPLEASPKFQIRLIYELSVIDNWYMCSSVEIPVDTEWSECIQNLTSCTYWHLVGVKCPINLNNQKFLVQQLFLRQMYFDHYFYHAVSTDKHTFLRAVTQTNNHPRVVASWVVQLHMTLSCRRLLLETVYNPFNCQLIWFCRVIYCYLTWKYYDGFIYERANYWKGKITKFILAHVRT